MQFPSSSLMAVQPIVLESRSEYRACHIRVPDQEHRLAAIQVADQYYSFFKTAKDKDQALQVAARLALRGDPSVLTKAAKGYAIWVLEPEAYLGPQTKIEADVDNGLASLSNCKILEARSDYQSCHIQVPDLDKYLAAIQYEGKYYALLKTVHDRQQALELAARMSKRGDPILITRTSQGDAVWVLEPDAIPLR